MTPEQQNQQVLALLHAIHRVVVSIEAAMSSGKAHQSGNSSSGPADGSVADDRDLDGQHGDPTIKFDPSAKYWGGASYVGYRFSETEPEYLDSMAKYLDACAYMAEKDTDEKKRNGARYKRKDAARARGWAARLRSGGWSPPAPQGSTGGDYGSQGPQPPGGSMDDIPF